MINIFFIIKNVFFDIPGNVSTIKKTYNTYLLKTNRKSKTSGLE